MTRAASIAAAVLAVVAIVFLWRALEPPPPPLKLLDDDVVLSGPITSGSITTTSGTTFSMRPSDEAAMFMLMRGYPTDAGIRVSCFDGAKLALYTDDAGEQRLVCR